MWGVAAALLILLPQAADYGAEGWKALEADKYEEAVQLFSKAVETDPKDYTAHFNLGLAYSMLGKDAEAIPAYRKALELKPGLYEAELNLGILLLKWKQAGEAVPPLKSAAEQKPKEFRPVFYLAEALFATGDFARAEQDYGTAAELDPKSAATQLGLGRSKARQKRIEEGAENFRKAAELDASFSDALLELAELYEREGKAAEAIAIYLKFPDNAGARERAGELLLETKKPDEAIPHLLWAAGKSPTPANRLALATAYVKTDQADKALPLMEQALAAEPSNTELRMMYGRTLRDLKKYQPAAAEFWSVAQAKPEAADAWSELAGMLILLDNYPQALAALDRVKALGAETAGHHFFRALVLDKTRQLKPALESYETFLAQSDGKNPQQEFQARQRVRIIQKELNRR